MPGVSPVGVAENGTRSGKESFDLVFMCGVFPNLPSCLPSLAAGLVPAGQHYYEGSDSSAQRVTGLHAAEVSLLISIELLSIPSLTTLLPFRDARFPSLRFQSPSSPPHDPCGISRHPELGLIVDWCAVRVRDLLGRSPTGLAKSSSLALRTAHSSLVALHPFC